MSNVNVNVGDSDRASDIDRVQPQDAGSGTEGTRSLYQDRTQRAASARIHARANHRRQRAAQAVRQALRREGPPL